MTRQVQVSAGDVCDLGYHAVWCPKYRRPVLGGRAAARCVALIGAKAAGHGWRMVALEIMPVHVHMVVQAHPSDSPSRVASKFQGFTSRYLRAGLPHLRCRRPAWWSRSYVAAMAGAVPAGTARYIDTQIERPWRTEQEARAVRLLADHCDLYNAALEERREAWRMHRASICYRMQSAQLREIRRADPHGQGRHSFTAQQQTLRRLDTLFAAFYTRAKQGTGKAGYPRFKPYSRFGQAGFVAGDGAKWTAATPAGWARTAFQAVGSVKVRQHRAVPGTVKFVQLKREYRRWYVIVITDTEPVPLPAAGRAVGVDLGVARFLTTSDGQITANPRFLASAGQTITDLQRRKEQTRRGSGNRTRIRRQLAREWRKVRHRRRDFHHKTARALVNSCDTIALEKLSTAGLTRRAAAKPDPDQPGAFLPNRAAAKAGLNRSILDAGWAQFATILSGKAEEAGRRVMFVNPAGTSIGCQHCGRTCTRPRQDTVICPVHGKMDADLNGARNIATRAGLGSGQAPTA